MFASSRRSQIVAACSKLRKTLFWSFRQPFQIVSLTEKAPTPCPEIRRSQIPLETERADTVDILRDAAQAILLRARIDQLDVMKTCFHVCWQGKSNLRAQ